MCSTYENLLVKYAFNIHKILLYEDDNGFTLLKTMKL